SPALPAHLPSRNSNFFHGESPALSGLPWARAGKTLNNTMPRITLVRICPAYRTRFVSAKLPQYGSFVACHRIECVTELTGSNAPQRQSAAKAGAVFSFGFS